MLYCCSKIFCFWKLLQWHWLAAGRWFKWTHFGTKVVLSLLQLCVCACRLHVMPCYVLRRHSRRVTEIVTTTRTSECSFECYRKTDTGVSACNTPASSNSTNRRAHIDGWHIRLLCQLCFMFRPSQSFTGCHITQQGCPQACYVYTQLHVLLIWEIIGSILDTQHVCSLSVWHVKELY